MKNDSLNYKFVFPAVIIAYFISQSIIVYFKPELSIYATLLQIPFFLIPIIAFKETTNFFTEYKINFKFPAVTIPSVFWALAGITLFELGIDVILRTILPEFILEQYYFLYKTYAEEMSNLIVNHSNTPLEFFIITFCVAVIPAICEELLCRGYLMQKISQNHSNKFAIIISAALFSIIHLNPISFIPIFVIGLLLGTLFYKTNSILPSILLHFINNFIVVLSVNYYNGNEINITSMPFAIICTLIGIIIMLMSIKFIRTNNYKILI